MRTKNTPSRYTLVQSEAGDWYVIPVSKVDDWIESISFDCSEVDWAHEVELYQFSFTDWSEWI